MNNNQVLAATVDKNATFTRLRKMVEEAMHRQMFTTKDYEQLSKDIYLHTRTMVSVTTLKRFWGYIDSDHDPSMSTLNALAQLVGYPNFSIFCSQQPADDMPPSNTVVSNHIDTMADLNEGDEVTLYWAPNRRCHTIYLGASLFRVESSEHTRLMPGNTFSCALMIEGEPLFIAQLVQDDNPPVNYVCGKKGGIRFDVKKKMP